jgi:hypothetical protein
MRTLTFYSISCGPKFPIVHVFELIFHRWGYLKDMVTRMCQEPKGMALDLFLLMALKQHWGF